jgi:hypothetical protein
VGTSAEGSGRAGNAKACSSRRHRFAAIRRTNTAPPADATISSKADDHAAQLTSASHHHKKSGPRAPVEPNNLTFDQAFFFELRIKHHRTIFWPVPKISRGREKTRSWS